MAVSMSVPRAAERGEMLRLVLGPVVNDEKILAMAKGQDLVQRMDVAFVIPSIPNQTPNIMAARAALERDKSSDVRLTYLEACYPLYKNRGPEMLSTENTILSSGKCDNRVCSIIAVNTENEATMKKLVDMHAHQKKNPEIVRDLVEKNDFLNSNKSLKDSILKYIKVGGILGKLRGK